MFSSSSFTLEDIGLKDACLNVVVYIDPHLEAFLKRQSHRLKGNRKEKIGESSEEKGKAFLPSLFGLTGVLLIRTGLLPSLFWC